MVFFSQDSNHNENLSHHSLGNWFNMSVLLKLNPIHNPVSGHLVTFICLRFFFLGCLIGHSTKKKHYNNGRGNPKSSTDIIATSDLLMCLVLAIIHVAHLNLVKATHSKLIVTVCFTICCVLLLHA